MPRFGPYKFYNDEIVLWFYSDTDRHEYVREYGPEEVAQRGVTTILRIIDKSEYLIPWASKKVSEKVAATMPLEDRDLDVYTKSLPLAEFLDLLDAAKKAPREILDDAGNVGGQAHQSLEDSIRYAINTNGGRVEKLINIPKDPRAVSCCSAALDWMTKHDVKWVCTERKIYSKEYEFAGTMDGVAFVTACGDPVCCPVHFTDALSVIDWKSSNQLSVSYLYQVAAYRAAYVEETNEKVTDAFILRLGKEDGEFEPWHTTDAELKEDFGAFISCLTLTNQHEYVKLRMSESKKARTVRKRAAKALDKETLKLAAKEAKSKAKKEKKCQQATLQS